MLPLLQDLHECLHDAIPQYLLQQLIIYLNTRMPCSVRTTKYDDNQCHERFLDNVYKLRSALFMPPKPHALTAH